MEKVNELKHDLRQIDDEMNSMKTKRRGYTFIAVGSLAASIFVFVLLSPVMFLAIPLAGIVTMGSCLYATSKIFECNEELNGLKLEKESYKKKLEHEEFMSRNNENIGKNREVTQQRSVVANYNPVKMEDKRNGRGFSNLDIRREG